MGLLKDVKKNGRITVDIVIPIMKTFKSSVRRTILKVFI